MADPPSLIGFKYQNLYYVQYLPYVYSELEYAKSLVNQYRQLNKNWIKKRLLHYDPPQPYQNYMIGKSFELQKVLQNSLFRRGEGSWGWTLDGIDTRLTYFIIDLDSEILDIHRTYLFGGDGPSPNFDLNNMPSDWYDLDRYLDQKVDPVEILENYQKKRGYLLSSHLFPSDIKNEILCYLYN